MLHQSTFVEVHLVDVVYVLCLIWPPISRQIEIIQKETKGPAPTTSPTPCPLQNPVYNAEGYKEVTCSRCTSSGYMAPYWPTE